MKPPASNVGKWAYINERTATPRPYGDTVTYREAADWLAPCATVEDWGCGRGWARQFFAPVQEYRGLDGSAGPFVDEVVDLAEHVTRPPVEGVLMRHVLEHNDQWRRVLAGALASCSSRMALVTFVPFGDEEAVLTRYAGYGGVPDIQLVLADVEAELARAGCSWQREDYATATQYGHESLFRVSR